MDSPSVVGMVKRLKRRPAVKVDRDDLAVETTADLRAQRAPRSRDAGNCRVMFLRLREASDTVEPFLTA